MEPAALTPESFSFLALFLRADWVVKSVLAGLALASLWSWTIIFDKTFRFAALNRQALEFEQDVASGRSLEEVAAEAGENPSHPLPRMLQGALREWRETRNRGQLNDGQVAFLIQRIDRVLDTTVAREAVRIESGLSALAIVATASPFVGLFGTVWGIMRSFASIAASQNTSLAVVAPGIAEALFATAIGLFAAIPAVIGYNRLLHRVNRLEARLSAFSEEYLNLLSRQLDGMDSQ
jgi:biopolymer transport protein TolQ